MSNHIIVKLRKNKNVFEILAYTGTIEKYRGNLIGWDKVYVVENVFKNVKKGDLYTQLELEQAFSTTNMQEIMQIIAMKGEYQLSSEERKNKMDQKRKQVVNFIHTNYINPKTNICHPITAIESALNSLKIRIDMNESAEKQVQLIVKKLPVILPIKKSVIEGVLRIPNTHSGKVMGIIGKWATIVTQNWGSANCEMHLSLVAGNYDSLMKELSSKIQDNFEFNVANDMSSTNTDVTTSKTKKSRKKGKGKNKNKP